MKNFKLSIAYLAMFAMIFTSCSKEETDQLSDQDTVQLTFGTLLNDLNRQAVPAECRDGDPAYVAVGITDDDGLYVGGGTTDVHWINIDLVNNNGSWETKYSSELELPAGDYTLQHFVVYDDNDDVLWVAPRVGGTFATSVGTPLPQNIELAAGTKPYIEVDVLCYFAREEAAYGYPFFEIDVTEVENSYCIFVNFCDDETGREYPANFRVDVWSDAYGGDDLVISQTNDITMAGQWPSASVLCIALPDLQNNTYYARVTVINNNLLDYAANADDYYEFTITQDDIDAQLVQEDPRYHHVRVNCGDTPPPTDGTCVIPTACELNLVDDLDPGCYVVEPESDEDGWVTINSAEDLEFQLLNILDDPYGDVEVSLNDDNEVTVTIDGYEDTDRVTGFAIQISPNEDGDRSETCWESECGNIAADDQLTPVTHTFAGFDYSYPIYVRVNAVICEIIVN